MGEKDKKRHSFTIISDIPMIIVQIKGGLGNQLFQYAAARTLAIKNNTSFKFDIGFYKNGQSKIYKLNHFNICENIATSEEIDKFKGFPKKSLYIKIKRRFSRKGIEFYTNYHVKEKPFAKFEPKVLKLKGDLYLEGYWANQNYFLPIEQIIRKEFTLKSAFDKQNHEIAQKIINSNSISIHIRRGDFTLNPVFGLCPMQYYDDAINYIFSRVEKPSFFIFSDDFSWAKYNLKKNLSMEYIDINGAQKDYFDLRLMSLCKHNIIANSTFSWWGAWLNDNPEKIVVAPKVWFNLKKAQNIYKNSDFVPLNWVRLL